MGGVAKILIQAAVVGGAAFTGGASLWGLSVLQTSLVLGVGSLVLGFAQQALTPKPKIPNLSSFSQQASARTSMIKQPIVNHKLVYGEVRVSGPLVYFSSTSSKKFHHMVIVLAAHEVEAINTVYLNDIPIFNDHLDGSGNVNTGRYNGKVRIKKHLGTTTQAADSDLVSEVSEWTTAHRLRGRAYLYVRIEFNKDVFPTGLPNISAVVKGKKVLDTRDSLTKWMPNPALIIHDHLLDSEYGRAADTADIETSFTTASANSSEEFVGVEAVTHTLGTVDTTNNVLNVDKDRLLVQTGDRFQLTTSGTLPAGLSLVTDYYAIVYHEQAESAHSSATASIQVASSYANALAGTVVNITGTGSGTHTLTKTAEPRYTCNGIIETDKKPNSIIQDLLTSMGGRVTFIGGTWRILAAVYTAPTITLDESDLISSFRVRTKISRRERFNRVKGVYATPLSQGQPTDYPPVTNATYLANDNNKPIWKELDLPYTSRPQSAQRLAKIELERMRQEITIEADFKLSAYRVQAGDTVSINNDRAGFSSKVFEVIESAFDVGSDKQKVPFLFIKLTLRETASGVFDFTSATEETTVDLSPNTTLGNPFDVLAPTSLALESGTNALFLKGDGTVVSRIKVTWTDSVDGFVIDYEIQFKKTSDSNWEQSLIISKSIQQAFIWDVDDGEDYDVRLRSRNSLGIVSDQDGTTWTETVLAHTVIGKTASPNDVNGFSAQQNGALTTFQWDQNSDIDIGGYEIRFGAIDTFTWDSASVITSVTKGTLITNGAVPPGTWRLAIKAVDTSGNYSDTAATFDLTITNTNDIIDTNESHPRWPGTFSGCHLHDVSCKVVPNSTTVPSGDNYDVFDEFCEDAVSEFYYEEPEYDAGFDIGMRVWSNIVAPIGPGESGVSSPIFLIDFRLAAGSYAGFNAFTSGQITARYIKTRAKVVTATGKASILSFERTADIEERTENASGVVIAGSGGTAIIFTNQFSNAPSITVTPQGTGALFAVISAITGTGFTIQVFNNSGTDVGGTVDWQAIGA